MRIMRETECTHIDVTLRDWLSKRKTIRTSKLPIYTPNILAGMYQMSTASDTLDV